MVRARSIRDLESRSVLESGLVRSDDSGKVDYTLALDGPMFERYAIHMTEGAQKGGARNWLLAHTEEDHDRFRRGFLRHVIQYLNGEEDEDHAAAIIFSMNGMEYIKERIEGGALDTPRTTPAQAESPGQALADRILQDESAPEVPTSSEYEPSGRWALQLGDDESMALVWVPTRQQGSDDPAS